MATYLDDLLAGAHRRVADAAAREPLETLRERARSAPAGPSFRQALAVPGVQLIAEVKRASPSKGDLAPDLEAPVQARAYVDGGAAAVSVLTEPDRFKGTLGDLADVAALGIPALRKDFVVDAYQVWEARAAGASAVLLIVAALDEAALNSLLEESAAAGLDVLTEVHDADEIAIALRAGADIVGVNARDLRTFELDRDGFARLRPLLPDGVLAVSESGVRDADDVRLAAAQGADAVLVGETLVRAADPAAAVAELVAAGRTVATSAVIEPMPDEPPPPADGSQP
ncbi:indole-3-glycerol phosphate synthase TrpC [Nitriliruptor alkaliphilus]|uniref:indole-3-glycerol phosphate synthase TrpC n=1 Tax=Nitriliruptor alkaliphilus TaxID=427918 RepID=UPI0009FA3D19|nr:indole-3-glycerol phosphate synthase TrpC [Nitriliruptor alkaliphilus]